MGKIIFADMLVLDNFNYMTEVTIKELYDLYIEPIREIERMLKKFGITKQELGSLPQILKIFKKELTSSFKRLEKERELEKIKKEGRWVYRTTEK